MMAEQYPELDPNDLNYKTRQKWLQNRLDAAGNWQMAQKRHARHCGCILAARGTCRPISE